MSSIGTGEAIQAIVKRRLREILAETAATPDSAVETALLRSMQSWCRMVETEIEAILVEKKAHTGP